MKVFVYKCLGGPKAHRGTYSIKALNGPLKGRVIAHAEKVYLSDVEFKVNEAGRQRVLKTGHKNVHAGVVGELRAAKALWTADAITFLNVINFWWTQDDDDAAADTRDRGVRFIYDPRKFRCFVQVSDHKPIRRAGRAFLIIEEGGFAS